MQLVQEKERNLNAVFALTIYFTPQTSLLNSAV